MDAVKALRAPAGDIDLKEFSKHFSKSRNDRKGLGDRISEWMIRRLEG